MGACVLEPDVDPVVNIRRDAQLSRLPSRKNPDLLEAIFEHEPESFRATAELVDRDYKQVHRNLSELEDIGVIGFEGSGSGQAKNPLLAHDDLEIDIPFAGSE